MSKRKGISKQIRFEVFKRDSFKCQYCGRTAPDVVLEIDHIKPVAKDGDNDIMNLITSCFDCNRGKSNKTLADNSVVEKQRKQLELLQERREQIELMLEWKKSLSSFESDIVDMLVEYINTKILPSSLNDNGKRSVAKWLKNFSTEKILDAVDISASKYLKYEKGELDRESAELFFNKIGGVMVVKNLPPIKQKLVYIKGIARNRFSYWDDRKGSIILSNYINELKQHYDDEQLLSDLDNVVIKLTKEVNNWSEWKNTIEKWILDIQNWGKKSTTIIKNEKVIEDEYTQEQLENFVYYRCDKQNDIIKALEHIATIFPKYDKHIFREVLNNSLIDFLSLHNDFENSLKDNNEIGKYISKYIQQTEVIKEFIFDDNDIENFGMLSVLFAIVNELLQGIFYYCYYPTINLNQEYLKIMIDINIIELRKNKTSIIN